MSLIKNHPIPVITYENEAWLPYIISYADRICYLNEGLYEYDRSMCNNSLSIRVSKKSADEIFMDHIRAYGKAAD